MAELISAAAKRLVGKVALITGGASGIGECISKVFAFHGAKVVIADIQDEMGRSLASHISATSDCLYVDCDVTDEAQVASAVDNAVAKFGRLDIMVNNAGIGGSTTAKIVDCGLSNFNRVMSVNAAGVFLGTKHAARIMVPAKRGAIINTSSISACVAGTASHAYTTSKHAVVGLTRNAAAELGQYGIRVNCILPFVLATPLATKYMAITDEQLENSAALSANLKGVTLKTEDVANAALFLSSDESRYVSGLNLVLDGGFCTVNSALNIF